MPGDLAPRSGTSSYSVNDSDIAESQSSGQELRIWVSMPRTITIETCVLSVSYDGVVEQQRGAGRLQWLLKLPSARVR